MNKYLIKLANHLDKKGLYKEADYIDGILTGKINDMYSESGADEAFQTGGVSEMVECFMNILKEEMSIVFSRVSEPIKEKLSVATEECIKENIGFKMPPWPTKEEVKNCLEKKLMNDAEEIGLGLIEDFTSALLEAFPRIVEKSKKCLPF